MFMAFYLLVVSHLTSFSTGGGSCFGFTLCWRKWKAEWLCQIIIFTVRQSATCKSIQWSWTVFSFLIYIKISFWPFWRIHYRRCNCTSPLPCWKKGEDLAVEFRGAVKVQCSLITELSFSQSQGWGQIQAQTLRQTDLCKHRAQENSQKRWSGPAGSKATCQELWEVTHSLVSFLRGGRHPKSCIPTDNKTTTKKKPSIFSLAK